MRITRHAMRSRPEIRPALARVAIAKPIFGLLSVLLSMIGWMTAPSEDPDETMVIARARRLAKYWEMTAIEGR